METGKSGGVTIEIAQLANQLGYFDVRLAWAHLENRRVPNGTHGGVRGRRIYLNPPPTRFCLYLVIYWLFGESGGKTLTPLTDER